MKYFLIIQIWTVLLCLACYQQKRDNEVAAKIGSDCIMLSSIDSMLEPSFNKMRLDVLERLISKHLIEKEARIRKLPIEQFIEMEINSKIKLITKTDIERFIIQNNLDTLNRQSIDYETIRRQLILINRKFRHSVLIDSLKQVYSVEVKINETEKKSINLSRLHDQYIGNESAKVDFYIIATYECSACTDKIKQMDNIIRKYSEYVKFHFVFYASKLSKTALACELAGRQGKYWELHNYFIENTISETDSAINKSLERVGVDLQLYNNSLSDTIEIQRNFFENCKVIENAGIFSVPSFVINNELIPSNASIHDIEQIILFNLQTLNK